MKAIQDVEEKEDIFFDAKRPNAPPINIEDPEYVMDWSAIPGSPKEIQDMDDSYNMESSSSDESVVNQSDEPLNKKRRKALNDLISTAGETSKVKYSLKNRFNDCALATKREIISILVIAIAAVLSAISKVPKDHSLIW